MARTALKLSADLDRARLREAFAGETRVFIDGLLDGPSLERLSKAVRHVPQWMRVTRLGGRHVMLDAAEMDRIAGPKKAEFETHVHAGARDGFQYLYDAFPLYGKWHAGTLEKESAVLAEAFRFLGSEPFLAMMRDVLSMPEIGFVDAQLTRYRPGHFLTEHDDSQDKSGRLAAYVLNLTESWRADWGGQLQFLDGDGQVTRSFVPRRNTLAVFKVPQPHVVSCVAPYAGGDRISITGWLRAGEDPGPDAVG